MISVPVYEKMGGHDKEYRYGIYCAKLAAYRVVRR